LKFDDFKIECNGKYITTITEEKNKAFGDLVEDDNPVHFNEDRMKNIIFWITAQ